MLQEILGNTETGPLSKKESEAWSGSEK
jgi:hypothetical protein